MYIQWKPLIMDTLGQPLLSIITGCPLSPKLSKKQHQLYSFPVYCHVYSFKRKLTEKKRSISTVLTEI